MAYAGSTTATAANTADDALLGEGENERGKEMSKMEKWRNKQSSAVCSRQILLITQRTYIVGPK